MAKMLLEDGFEELTIEFSKTIQDLDFEPRRITVRLKKMCEADKYPEEINRITDLMELEVFNALGMELNETGDDK